jgi:hypothetical protein
MLPGYRDPKGRSPGRAAGSSVTEHNACEPGDPSGCHMPRARTAGLGRLPPAILATVGLAGTRRAREGRSWHRSGSVRFPALSISARTYRHTFSALFPTSQRHLRDRPTAPIGLWQQPNTTTAISNALNALRSQGPAGTAVPDQGTKPIPTPLLLHNNRCRHRPASDGAEWRKPVWPESLVAAKAFSDLHDPAC